VYHNKIPNWLCPLTHWGRGRSQIWNRLPLTARTMKRDKRRIAPEPRRKVRINIVTYVYMFMRLVYVLQSVVKPSVVQPQYNTIQYNTKTIYLQLHTIFEINRLDDVFSVPREESIDTRTHNIMILAIRISITDVRTSRLIDKQRAAGTRLRPNFRTTIYSLYHHSALIIIF